MHERLSLQHLSSSGCDQAVAVDTVVDGTPEAWQDLRERASVAKGRYGERVRAMLARDVDELKRHIRTGSLVVRILAGIRLVGG